MKRAYTLILLAFATVACFTAAPAKKTKKPAAAITSKTARKGGARAASHNAKTRTGAKVASTTKVRYVRGRHGKLVRVVSHTAPAPSYQLRPDAERYQQIQQALTDKGYFKGEVNGTWGDDSIDSLRRFQTDRKLDGDGHLTALSLTGLGLGPRHDHDLSAPAAVAPIAVPNGSSSNAGLSTKLTPVNGISSAPTPTVSGTCSASPVSGTCSALPPVANSTAAAAPKEPDQKIQH